MWRQREADLSRRRGWYNLADDLWNRNACGFVKRWLCHYTLQRELFIVDVPLLLATQLSLLPLSLLIIIIGYNALLLVLKKIWTRKATTLWYKRDNRQSSFPSCQSAHCQYGTAYSRHIGHPHSPKSESDMKTLSVVGCESWAWRQQRSQGYFS